ncbi:hypothetical protein H6F61_23570 [Cyanobacteria bacterium FACHB-472]|nr:hypothetical protein [Cyanobacteria bacterium FACHB-472]
MLKRLSINRESLFSSKEGNKFPKAIVTLADIKPYEADVDVIIGAHRQPEAVNVTIENYLALEKKNRLHFFVIESSRNPLAYWKIRERECVSKVFILNNIRCTKKNYENVFWASNGAAIAAQIGTYLGCSRYAFFSHSDMMGYKENFLSFLLSKLDEKTPLASFTQRHILPFSGGMLYDKNYFKSLNADWLPSSENFYNIPELELLRNRIEHLNWIDAGEKLILAALQRGQKAYVCASRGSTGDYYGHALTPYGLTNQEVSQLGVPIYYAPDLLSREAFKAKYPELATEKGPFWRQCFDDEGDVIFVHRGRGTSKGQRKDQRGDFVSFVREFNQRYTCPA